MIQTAFPVSCFLCYIICCADGLGFLRRQHGILSILIHFRLHRFTTATALSDRKFQVVSLVSGF